MDAFHGLSLASVSNWFGLSPELDLAIDDFTSEVLHSRPAVRAFFVNRYRYILRNRAVAECGW